MAADPVATIGSPAWAFVRWAGAFGAALQGFWLVTSIYIVTEVGLTAAQLLLLGVALEVTILVAEVPTGVVADTLSRRWSLVTAMAVMGASFVAAGLSSSFIPLVVANIGWGVGWTFASGADVAWISDELAVGGADQETIDRTLTTKARWQQRGGAVGLVAFGLLGWLAGLAPAMVAAGGLLFVAALWIVVLFDEEGFHATRTDRLGHSAEILRSGLALVGSDRVVIRLLAVTLLFNLGAEAVDRLTETRIIDLGLPFSWSPIVFFTALGMAGLVAGAGLLRLVERRLVSTDGPRLVYGAMSLLAALGAVLLATGPGALTAAVGVFLARGLAWSVLPVVGSVWINRATEPASRATVQSFLGQATSAGQILGGLLLGVVAANAGIRAALTLSAVLFALSGCLIIAGKNRPGRRSSVGRAR